MSPAAEMNATWRKRQFWLLLAISAALLLGAPDVWVVHPDSGIYIGSAESLATEGRYWFNFQPNLLYYPGFSALLTPLILAFETDFLVLNLFMATIVIAALWLCRSYFMPERFGLVGLAVPILLGLNREIFKAAYHIITDGTFLALSIGCLLLWRRYAESRDPRMLAACCMAVAFAPMVRFQGLFLVGALVGALLIDAVDGGRVAPGRVARALAVGLAALSPFIAWTLRNLALYTPDTFNFANAFFFGLEGLPICPGGCGSSGGAVESWHVALSRIAHGLANISAAILSQSVDFRILGTVSLSLLIGLPLVALFVAGGRDWFRAATSMERLYVLSLLGFMVFDVVFMSVREPRHWLPVMPFLLVMGGFGLLTVRDRLARTPLRELSNVAMGLFVASVLFLGTTAVITITVRTSYAFHRAVPELTEPIAANLDTYVGRDVPIATTDWGVMPRAIKRPSFPIVGGADPVPTFDLMVKYGTQYLIILDHVGRRPPHARKLVADYPQFFVPRMETNTAGGAPYAAVFSINLPGIRHYLESRRGGQTRPTG